MQKILIIASVFIMAFTAAYGQRKASSANYTVDEDKGIEQFSGKTFKTQELQNEQFYLWVKITDKAIQCLLSESTVEPNFNDRNVNTILFTEVLGNGGDYTFSGTNEGYITVEDDGTLSITFTGTGSDKTEYMGTFVSTLVK